MRDLDLIKQFPGAYVSWSINTLDEEFRREMDRAVSIERAKGKCNLVWLENLNLRGDYKGRILEWIHAHHPELDELYRETYTKKRRDY